MNIKNVQQLIDVIGKFKDLKRSGWVNKKVVNPESDAEHSFSVAFMTMLMAPDNLDKEKCLKLALIHDLAEIYAGDYTPDDNITAKEKQKKELIGIKRVADELGEGDLVDLFNEFTDQSSKEALFVNALDKIDNVITARYYDNNKRSPINLTAEFASYAKCKIDDMPDIKELQNIKQLLKDVIIQSNQ